MKKIILATALLGFVSGAQAARGQIYVGPFIGSNNMDAKFDAYNKPADQKHNLKTGSRDFMGGLVVGYAYPCNNLLMGFEILGNLNTLSKKIVSEKLVAVNESFKFEHKASYGFAARFGYRTTVDAVLYARLGGEWSHYKLSYSGTDTVANATLRVSKTKTLFTFVPGVGIEMPVGGKWKARLEAKYSLPQKVKMTIGNSVPGSFAYENSSPRMRVGHTAVVMGVTYNFG
ncbi:outer membrane protein [Candidatus Odyssella thessalonicensis]|uniref:outer membrane protein n=1 Tax=Candidatus Odyssella thessalonicensis TaxID=84647 RepID=UPI000225A9D2|nr:outer membrane beta-barrel protein [Candidatus Odyssella thessalonicensis]